MIPSKRPHSKQPNRKRGCCIAIAILVVLALLYMGSLVWAVSGWDCSPTEMEPDPCGERP